MATDFDIETTDIKKIKDIILDRAKNISNTDEYDVEDEITKEIEKIVTWWDEKAKALNGNEILQYSKESAEHKLIIPYDKENESNEKQTLQSMRNFDKQCKVEIITFEEI